MTRGVLIWSCIGIAALVALAFLAAQVGGIAVRRAPGEGLNLNVSEPVILGVQTVARWEAPAGVANSPVVLIVRSLAGEVQIGAAALGDERADVIFPCALESQASLVLQDERTQQQLDVLQDIEYLPPGPDCLQ